MRKSPLKNHQKKNFLKRKILNLYQNQKELKYINLLISCKGVVNISNMKIQHERTLIQKINIVRKLKQTFCGEMGHKSIDCKKRKANIVKFYAEEFEKIQEELYSISLATYDALSSCYEYISSQNHTDNTNTRSYSAMKITKEIELVKLEEQENAKNYTSVITFNQRLYEKIISK